MVHAYMSSPSGNWRATRRLLACVRWQPIDFPMKIRRNVMMMVALTSRKRQMVLGTSKL
jgi:hypothetical protein